MPATIKLGDTGDDVKRLQRVFVRTKDLGPDNLDAIHHQPVRLLEVLHDFLSLWLSAVAHCRSLPAGALPQCSMTCRM